MTTTLGRPVSRQRWVGLAVLVLAVTLVALDATVLSLALPSISETLHPSGTQLLWIGDSYSFVLAGLLVSMGALSDRIGRKKLLLLGSSAFGAASLLAAYAPSAGWLILARALLGVAGATIMPSTLSLIRSLFPDARERATAIGIWGAGATAGAALGPVVGGVLLEHFWWGSVFLLNLPILALLLVLGAWLLPESKDPNPGRWDVLSVLLSMTGVIGVVYAIKEAAAGGLGHWPVPVAFALGATALTVFVRRQLRLPTPLLDVRLFTDPRFTAAVLGSLASLIGLSGVIFFMSQYLQLVRGYSPLTAGLAELPAFVGAVAGGLLTARLARRTGARVTLVGGLLVMGLGIAVLGWVQQDSSYLVLGSSFLAVGTAEGIVYTLSADLVLTAAPADKAGAASAVSETAYELGTALGIALVGSVVTAIYAATLVAPAGTDPAVAAQAEESIGNAVEAAGTLPGELGAQLLTASRDAFVHGMNIAAFIAAALLLSAAAFSWYLLRRRAGDDASAEQPSELVH
ncbi:DHA2 family multidrug resistance protein-like MFS transporter [Kitasatospora gansuensis]|uniref:DHA2 family multidrug resistance protein-like MFS transporter n=1 Tax=Kitasatospora gansuensis TaxID=258050 RepID=A0A7W7WFU9_9ACTN|nr:MFS transporter [Kitasatospora gansuensis]MBB4944774.1 DHA2 family multidrug resistance protein-like MFS transporter [Kitasatospora gansuensis]